MAKFIELTRGYRAAVSDEDYERINSRNWFAVVGTQIRAARMENRQMIYMHHEVLEIMPWTLNGQEVDHEDGDPLNNCRDNLKLVTHTENMRNTRRHKERKGYAFNFRANLYTCYLDEPGQKRRYLGYTKTEAEAIARVAEARGGENN